VDLTRTILAALGLEAPAAAEGVDLRETYEGASWPVLRPLTASLGPAYSTRWGPWLLRGKLGRRPTLCRADVDPECTEDLFASNVHAGPGLWRATYEALQGGREAEREPEVAVLDRDTAAALRVFGH